MRSARTSSKNLFFNTLHRQQPMMLFFSILSFICLPVLMLLGFSTMTSIQMDVPSGGYEWRVEELLNNLGIVSVFLSCGYGIFAGCAVMRPFMKRTSSVLFGSLPVRREKQFMAFTLSGAVCYLTATAVAMLGSFLILMSRQVLVLSGMMYLYILQGMVWFAFFYALTLLIGTLCGMSSIQALLTGVVSFYLPVVWMLILWGLDSFVFRFMSISSLMEYSVMRYLSPFLNLCYETSRRATGRTYGGGMVYTPYPARFEIVYAVAAVLLFLAAVWILRKRDHAKAEQPVPFRGVSEAVKYALMLPATLLCGMVFYEIAGGVAAIFGLAIGMVLSFMVLNVILKKNPRAFFSGIRGLGIFAVAFTVLTLTVMGDPLGVDKYIPPDASVAEAEVWSGSVTITVTKPEQMALVREILQYAQNSRDDGAWDSSISVRYKLKNGLEISKYAPIRHVEMIQDKIDALMSAENRMESLLRSIQNGDEVLVSTLISPTHQKRYTLARAEREQLVAWLRLYAPNIGAEDCGPVTAVIQTGRSDVGIPVYLSGAWKPINDYLASICDGVLTEKNLDDFLSYLIWVEYYDPDPGETVRSTDKAVIREKYLASVGVIPGMGIGNLYRDGAYEKNELTFGARQMEVYDPDEDPILLWSRLRNENQ